MESIESILVHYPDRQSALLPALNRAQRHYGWISPEAIKSVSEILGLTPAHVRGVASFHVLFHQREMGRNMVQLCTNVSCMLLGAETLLDILASRFGLKTGQTTEDGRFSLMIMECIGACDTAPAMLVNSDFHTCVDKDTIIDILEGYK